MEESPYSGVVLELQVTQLNPRSNPDQPSPCARTRNDYTLSLAAITMQFFALAFKCIPLGDCHSEGTSIPLVLAIRNGLDRHETRPRSLEFPRGFQVTSSGPNERQRCSGVLETSKTSLVKEQSPYFDAVLALIGRTHHHQRALALVLAH